MQKFVLMLLLFFAFLFLFLLFLYLLLLLLLQSLFVDDRQRKQKIFSFKIEQHSFTIKLSIAPYFHLHLTEPNRRLMKVSKIELGKTVENRK